MATGKADGFADDDPADAFIDMIYGLRRGYRQNARWLMNDLTTAKVRKFKDGQGNYLWQPSSQMGEPAMFMGYGHEADDWMPDVAANATPVAFGDFMRGYLIIDRIGIRVLRDPFTNKPHIQFLHDQACRRWCPELPGHQTDEDRGQLSRRPSAVHDNNGGGLRAAACHSDTRRRER